MKYIENKDEINAKNNQYYQDNTEKVKAKSAEYRKENPEVMNEWRQANPEKITAQRKVWWAKNPEKRAAKNARDSAYAKKNPGKVNARNSRHRAGQTQATPTWADDFIISEAYELAQLRTKATGVVHHVDHIVPLRSGKVCGLHCEHNLRVIPGKENTSKGNRHWPDMP